MANAKKPERSLARTGADEAASQNKKPLAFEATSWSERCQRLAEPATPRAKEKKVERQNAKCKSQNRGSFPAISTRSAFFERDADQAAGADSSPTG